MQDGPRYPEGTTIPRARVHLLHVALRLPWQALKSRLTLRQPVMCEACHTVRPSHIIIKRRRTTHTSDEGLWGPRGRGHTATHGYPHPHRVPQHKQACARTGRGTLDTCVRGRRAPGGSLRGAQAGRGPAPGAITDRGEKSAPEQPTTGAGTGNPSNNRGAGAPQWKRGAMGMGRVPVGRLPVGTVNGRLAR